MLANPMINSLFGRYISHSFFEIPQGLFTSAQGMTSRSITWTLLPTMRCFRSGYQGCTLETTRTGVKGKGGECLRLAFPPEQKSPD